MIKVFFCEMLQERLFTKMWWCGSCNDVAKRETWGRGLESEFTNSPWVHEDPVVCPTCSKMAKFSSRGASPLFIRVDTGEEIDAIRKHPGACYVDPDGAWDSKSRSRRFGPDGRALNLILPNGFTWSIDSRASNCTMPDDNEHRCWVRHGSPEDGTLHVDKNGHTCQAGGGSILSGSYHGFCHNGYLISC